MHIRAVTLLVGATLCSSAIAAPINYFATLSGPNESPPNGSPGIGNAEVIIDPATHMMEVIVSFSGLGSGTTASHIHCCTATPFTGTAGVATQLPTFVGFPLGVTSGAYIHTFDLTLTSSWNAAFDGGTPASQEAALEAGLAAGTAYLNIHTNVFPSGEIRGFLVPAPEPGTLLLAGAALAGLAVLRRNRH